MTAKPSAAWLLILAVWGCQSTPTSAPDIPEAVEATVEGGTALLEQAARASGSRRARLYLQAAESLLDQGQTSEAGEALEAVEVERLRERESARYLLARARVAMAAGNLESVRSALLALDAGQLPDPTEAALLEARLLDAAGRPGVAAASLMALAPGATDPALAQRLSDAIWEHLGNVSAFDTLALASRREEPHRAWWLLKAQMLESFTLAEQRLRLEAWQRSWPEHPAALFPPASLKALNAELPAVTRVGLLLPLSGPLSRAGRAVRDAFIAAYLSQDGEASFEVRIYDAAAEPLGALYERALVAGADVLIGPLSKESVAEMNGLNPEIPVLALNYLNSEIPAPNLLQLGLAIEDEADTLAQWLADERVGRLVVFHNGEDWSLRARDTVARAWQGRLEVQTVEDIRTVTESVGVAMRVADSQTRRSEMEELLRQKVEFLPRARGDVDAVLALVSPVEASALVPALKFHFADHLPVYATSQTIRGANPDRLDALNGFRISELPWFVMEDGTYAPLNEAFALSGSPFAALYALGVDAFRLADRLPLILSGSFDGLLGSTGALKISPDGRITRRLAHAEVVRGTLSRAAGAR